MTGAGLVFTEHFFGCARFSESGFRTKGNIFGVTYYDEIDDRYFYHNIKYHFPIEEI